MTKQRWLAFVEEEFLETLWETFPEQEKNEVTEQFARLMARAAVERIRDLRKNPPDSREVSDESIDE